MVNKKGKGQKRVKGKKSKVFKSLISKGYSKGKKEKRGKKGLRGLLEFY
jgi:hypothetical protein